MTDPHDDAVLHRLEREREQAERRYVAALSALDAAAELPALLTESAAAAERDLSRLNQAWNQGAPRSADASASRGLKRILAELARMLPWRRRALHGALIAAVNRQAEVTRALLDATRHFQSHVVWYGQTVGGYASTRRQGAAGAAGVDFIHAAVNAMTTDWQKNWEALQSRDQRHEARMAALTKAYEDLKDVAALAHQGTAALRRIVEALPATTGEVPQGARATDDAPSPAMARDATAFTYVAFEDRFRGSPDEIRARLLDYLPLFEGAADVLDVGCGRGELLDLFRERSVAAKGIDINDEMVALCRSRGLTAERADGAGYLERQRDASLGGLIAIQVVEHLEPPYLIRFLDLAQRKLKPGAPVVLETINAACWTAFFDSYIRDFTHARPLHPETLRYLVQATGFTSADIQYRSPIAEHDKLPTVRLTASQANPEMADLAEALNAHAERLNSQLFTYRDYAIVGRR